MPSPGPPALHAASWLPPPAGASQPGARARRWRASSSTAAVSVPATCSWPSAEHGWTAIGSLRKRFAGGRPAWWSAMRRPRSSVRRRRKRRVIVVPDTTRALQRLATFVRRRSSARVVAITGSVGKTTTKELVAALLAGSYRVFRNEGNLNNHIGLPLSLLELRHDPEVAVVELGMNHAGEISTLVAIRRAGHYGCGRTWPRCTRRSSSRSKGSPTPRLKSWRGRHPRRSLSPTPVIRASWPAWRRSPGGSRRSESKPRPTCRRRRSRPAACAGWRPPSGRRSDPSPCERRCSGTVRLPM